MIRVARIEIVNDQVVPLVIVEPPDAVVECRVVSRRKLKTEVEERAWGPLVPWDIPKNLTKDKYVVTFEFRQVDEPQRLLKSVVSFDVV